MNENNNMTFAEDEVYNICRKEYSRGMDSGVLTSGLALIIAWGLIKGIDVLKKRKK